MFILRAAPVVGWEKKKKPLSLFLLGSVQQIVTVTISSEINVLVVGIMLVVFVVAAPEGILGLVKRWKKPSSR